MKPNPTDSKITILQQRKKKFWPAFSIFLLIIVLVACTAQTSQTPESTSALPIDPTTEIPLSCLEQIQERGVLIVGTAITEPFEFHDPQTNELIGFDIDTANYIANHFDVELSLIEMPFANLLPTLQDRKVDMTIAAMYITPEREELIDFADPYINTGLVMVIHPDSQINTVDDLNGLKVGVKIGATGAKLAQELVEQGIQIEILEYKDTLDSFLDLEVGRVDVVFNDYLNTLFYLKESQSTLKIVETDTGEVNFLSQANLGIAVHHEDLELLEGINDALMDMRQDGSFDMFYQKWLTSSSDSES
ncbi:MAG: ABC transporter substrate-binding protein [Anaerolineaceae bacterium]|nr:ABC transporter substrate-binding protein [Anaerolineaceae bacterium]